MLPHRPLCGVGVRVKEHEGPGGMVPSTCARPKGHFGGHKGLRFCPGGRDVACCCHPNRCAGHLAGMGNRSHPVSIECAR